MGNTEEAGKEKEQQKYVTFQSGNEFFGIQIQYVNEIIVFQQITEIPECASYIKGLINLRGKIIPVVDVRLRFGKEEVPYNDRTCIIVLNVNGMVVGLIVEKIAEVVEIPDENIFPSPTIGKGDASHHVFVKSIGKIGNSVKLLLDPERLLNDEDVAAIEQMDMQKSAETGE